MVYLRCSGGHLDIFQLMSDGQQPVVNYMKEEVHCLCLCLCLFLFVFSNSFLAYRVLIGIILLNILCRTCNWSVAYGLCVSRQNPLIKVTDESLNQSVNQSLYLSMNRSLTNRSFVDSGRVRAEVDHAEDAGYSGRRASP